MDDRLLTAAPRPGGVVADPGQHMQGLPGQGPQGEQVEVLVGVDEPLGRGGPPHEGDPDRDPEGGEGREGEDRQRDRQEHREGGDRIRLGLARVGDRPGSGAHPVKRGAKGLAHEGNAADRLPGRVDAGGQIAGATGDGGPWRGQIHDQLVEPYGDPDPEESPQHQPQISGDLTCPTGRNVRIPGHGPPLAISGNSVAPHRVTG